MKNVWTRLVGALALLFASAAIAQTAVAQTWPTRPVTLIVPFAPGGPADVLGRLVGQKLTEDLGQQVVVENRPGANTIIGAQHVARAKPDGYTILLAIDGTLVMNPYLYSKLPYDPFREFDPVALIALVPSALEANINVPASTLKELIAAEKAKPGTFFVGVSTPTSQVAAALINQLAGVNITMVPYGGGTTQITDLLAGSISLGHESLNVALPLWRDKKIKILALTGKNKSALAPELPLVTDDFPEFDLGIWQSVVVPAGTPRPIIDRLFAALGKAMAAPDLREKLAASGIEPTMSKSPEAFTAFLKAQAAIREPIIRAVGLKLD